MQWKSNADAFSFSRFQILHLIVYSILKFELLQYKELTFHDFLKGRRTQNILTKYHKVFHFLLALVPISLYLNLISSFPHIQILNERDRTSLVFNGITIDWANYEKYILAFACRYQLEIGLSRVLGTGHNVDSIKARFCPKKSLSLFL